MFADETFASKYHLQIDTIKCYSDEKGLQFHIFDFNETEKCKNNSVFSRRHCLLADIMENWIENDFVYAIDSDVISYDSEADWQNPEENVDLVFYERWWNGEIVAGKSFQSTICHRRGLTLQSTDRLITAI